MYHQSKKQFLLTSLILGMSQVSLATPAAPTITQWNLPATINQADNFTVEWNMWWGENGNRWEFYQNTNIIASGNLAANGNQAQQGTIQVNPSAAGNLNYHLALCNDSGCSSSQPFQVLVTGGNTGSGSGPDPEPIEPPTPVNTSTAPAKAQIDWFSEQGDIGTQTISWHMYWGENANRWYLLENGVVIHQANLTTNGKQAQTDSITFEQQEVGTYNYQVKLCKESNDVASCSVSPIKSKILQDATVIVIQPEPVDPQPPINNNGNLAANNVYQQNSGKVISSYFVEWGVYGRNYHVNDIPASNLTHIQYGFLAICGNNPSAIAASAIAQECQNKQTHEVTLVDRFAALEKTYPGDTWIDDVSGSSYNGNFGQLKKLKQRYPHLKILPSVGGWTQSDPFFDLAPVPENRAIFVNSVVAFLEKYDFFDGVDIDWEFPGGGGALNGAGGSQDTEAFTALMKELREGLDQLSAQTGREYQLTAAVGTGPEKIDFIDYSEVSQYMNYIFMMSYDYAGAWEGITGHHASLYANNEYHQDFNANAAVQNFIAAGAPVEKLVLGGAFYGRGWAGVTNSGSHATDLFPLYGSATDGASGTWEKGVFDYKDLYENYIGSNGTGINGYQVIYDSVAEAPYLWNAAKGEFISYDNPRSITKKAEYVLAQGLAGMMTWELDADNGLLLNAINTGLGNQEVSE